MVRDVSLCDREERCVMSAREAGHASRLSRNRSRRRVALRKAKGVVNIVDASIALAESKKNRLAGMSCSPNAISGRNDIQVAFQMLFNDKTPEQLRLESTWAAGRLDADQSGDAIDMLRRKMRAAVVQRGGNMDDWDTAFEHFDRDGSGELELHEFIKAVRKSVGVTKAEINDESLQRLFWPIDDDHSGSISAEELRQFIAWKPKQKRRGSLGPISPLSSTGASFGVPAEEAGARDQAQGAPTVAEYICVKRAILRETSDLSSKKVGMLSVGETVAVVRSVGTRLKCVRLRWGTELQNGWASRESDWGEPFLEKLPRVEWSAISHNDTAIAHRVSSLNDAKAILRSKKRHLRRRSGKALWAVVRDHVLVSEKTFEDVSKIRLDIDTEKTSSIEAPRPERVLTPRRKEVAATVFSCESVEEVSMLLDTLEGSSKESWRSEIKQWTRKERVDDSIQSDTYPRKTQERVASRVDESWASDKSGIGREYSAIDRVLLSHRRRKGRRGELRYSKELDSGRLMDGSGPPNLLSLPRQAGLRVSAKQASGVARAPKHLPPTAETAARLPPTTGQAMSRTRSKPPPILAPDTAQEDVAPDTPEPACELGSLGDLFVEFDTVDSDGDGYVSKSEFSAYRQEQTGATPTADDWKNFYRADGNGDGRISRVEFNRFMASFCRTEKTVASSSNSESSDILDRTIDDAIESALSESASDYAGSPPSAASPGTTGACDTASVLQQHPGRIADGRRAHLSLTDAGDDDVAEDTSLSAVPLNITTSADLTVDHRFTVIVNSVSPEFQSSGSDSGINFSVWATLTGFKSDGSDEIAEKPPPIKYDTSKFVAANGAAPTYGDVLWSEVPSDAVLEGSALKYIVHALAPDRSHRPKRLPSGLDREQSFSALVAVYFRAMMQGTVLGGPQCSIAMPPLGAGVFANDAADVMRAAVLAHAAYRASGGTASVSIALWSRDGKRPKNMGDWEAAASAGPPPSRIAESIRKALAPTGGPVLLSQVPPAHTTGELTALLEGSSDPMAAEFLAARAEKEKSQQKALKDEMAAGKWKPLFSSLAAQVNSSPPFTYGGFPTEHMANRKLVGADGYLCSAEFLHFDTGQLSAPPAVPAVPLSQSAPDPYIPAAASSAASSTDVAAAKAKPRNGLKSGALEAAVAKMEEDTAAEEEVSAGVAKDAGATAAGRSTAVVAPAAQLQVEPKDEQDTRKSHESWPMTPVHPP
eukprot:COSAG02_NODE_1013_length_15207_cov_4.700556_10_plen_1218_part_00